MKIRSGFVSNSSSSSFIVGVAKVTDEVKLREHLKSINVNLDKPYTLGIVKLNKNENNYDIKFKENSVRVSSFQTDVSIYGVTEGDTVFYVNIVNNEGDGDFSIYDENGEYYDLDYDIDFDFFSESDQNLYTVFKTDGIGIDTKKSEVTYGAGRNG